jgi:hypothetical protein
MTAQETKTTKESTNIKFIIEHSNGYCWEEFRVFSETKIEEARNNLKELKKVNPYSRYRLIRSEWQVVE